MKTDNRHRTQRTPTRAPKTPPCILKPNPTQATQTKRKRPELMYLSFQQRPELMYLSFQQRLDNLMRPSERVQR